MKKQISEPNDPQKGDQKKKRSRKNRAKKQKNQASGGNLQKPRGHLSDCAQRYAMALSNPFAGIQEPCVPDNNVTASYKISCRGVGTFTCGTNNVGFVAFAPKRFGNNFPASNSPVWYSLSTFAGSTITLTSGATVGEANMARFPYNTSDIGDGNGQIQARLVGAGLRIFYSGTELNRGGTIYAIRNPYNNTVHGIDGGEAASFSNTKIIPVDRRKHTICWKPTSADDFAYSNDPHNVAQNSVTYHGNANGPACMAFLVNSTPGNTFTYEIVSHYELLGTVLRGTPSESDATGMAAIFSAIPPVIETISAVMTGDVFKGTYKALEAMSGLYFGPPRNDRIEYTVHEL